MRYFRTATAVGIALAMSLSLAHTAAAQQSGGKVFRYSSSGDAIGLDPHINNEGNTQAMKENIYDGLVRRNRELKIEPALATDWKLVNPTTWRFNLRKGVKFHDGTPFTADDVVTSLNRIAFDEQSELKSYFPTLEPGAVKKIDDYTVEITTKGPDPILLSGLKYGFIMSKTWLEKNNTLKVVRGGNAETYANRNANGTGPFKLVERVPDTRTVLEVNKDWWDKKPEHNITRAEFKPIANNATRVAALLSSEIDLMYPVPLQDVARLKQTPNVKVLEGPELRTIFLGMDQWRDELLDMPGSGKNPFKDVRVRKAFYQAIDIENIKRVVMRGASTPTGLMVAPGVEGFDPKLNDRYPYDPEAAKKLLVEAGYPNGFKVTLDCPNDRYVNDEQICIAVVSMLAKVGIDIKLNAQTKGKHFDKIGKKEGHNTSFYMLGWTPTTFDAHNAMFALMAKSLPGSGENNDGQYNNPKFDDLTAKVAVELDQEKRRQMISEAFKIHREDFGHIPLHQQSLTWAATNKVKDAWLRPHNDVELRFVKLQ